MEIFFIDSERYEVLLLRKGQDKIEKLSQSGQLDEIFRDEILGIELTIPRDETQMPFEFGDVLKFETVLGPGGDMTLSAVNNSNTGNGSANVNADVGESDEFETGEWLIFSILFKAQYLFRIWVQDLNGNWAGGEGGFREFLFRVEEQPDLEPPHIEIMVNGEPLLDGAILREPPQFEIQITDAHSIDPETVQLAFARKGELLMPLELNQYGFEFDAAQATQAKIMFAPNLPNDDYQLQVLASDTSENTSDDQMSHFREVRRIRLT